MQTDFKNTWMSWLTYSGIQGLETLVLDWYMLLMIPGNDWNDQEALKLLRIMNSSLHFFGVFSNIVLAAAPASSLALGLQWFYMY